VSTLIKEATVVAIDEAHGAKPFQADILIDDGLIAAVGPNLDPGGAEVVEGRSRLVMPGLVNAHFHSSRNFLRGRYPGRPLEALMLYAYPFDPAFAMSPDLVYLRTLLVAIESLKNGVTCLLDDVIELPTQDLDQLDAVFRAYEDAGIRANCSGHVINKLFSDTLPYAREIFPDELVNTFRGAPPPTTDEFLDFSEEAVKRFHGRAGRLRYVVAPSGPQRCTDDLLLAAADFADKHDTAYHIHVLETKVQFITGRELYGKTLVQHLHDTGTLRERVTMAHAIWITDEDIELMADSGCSVAHNPICNLRIGAGIAPLRKLLDTGINVALGTDEIDCNDSARIFDVMHVAGLIHNVALTDYDEWPNAAEIIRAATLGGARSLMLQDEIGSIEPGKKADLVVLDLESAPFRPLNDPLVHLVYAENGSSVEHVLVGGEFVVRDRRLTRVDEDVLFAELTERLSDFRSRQDRWEETARQFEPYVKELYMRCMSEEVGIDRLATRAGVAAGR
jgi:cytosine/adenosine deaminase-related metal-dependent hydrolase